MSAITEYGFLWDDVEVTRLMSYEPRKGRGVYHVLGVKTPKADLQISVSPTGRVRVFKGAKELK